jgi:large subunit ribosomal protein L24e
MVLKTTLCRFSGLRIWPGRGMLYIRTDNQQWLFLSKKCKSLYNNRLRPAKLAWTTTYRCACGASLLLCVRPQPCGQQVAARRWRGGVRARPRRQLGAAAVAACAAGHGMHDSRARAR